MVTTNVTARIRDCALSRIRLAWGVVADLATIAMVPYGENRETVAVTSSPSRSASLSNRSPAATPTFKQVAFTLCMIAVVAVASGCRASTTGSAATTRPAVAARPTPPPSRAVPTLAGTPLVPRPDACKIVFVVGTGIQTLAHLFSEHGTPTGCGDFYYRADGSACIRTYVVGPNKCPDSPAPRMIVYLFEPGTSRNSQPGFLTCVRPDGATSSVCGVDRNYSLTADLSSAWTFSPFPAGAHRVAPQFSKLPTPLPLVNGNAPVDPQPGTLGDPIDCVGTATQQWIFHIASHTYVPGRCPAPWN